MSVPAASVSDIALAISAFRSDEPVIDLLRSAFDPGQPRFGAVIVVDSLGSGAISQAAQERGWDIHYINAETNLGSAGNLDLRLRTAAALGLKWCFASNHDGVVDVARITALAAHGNAGTRIGAVYPQLIFSSASGRPDSARRGFSSFGILGRGSAEASNKDCIEVAWSSSNGALYNLAAVREGISAWPELWMGYEDLALGWDLQRHGWKQLLCQDVTLVDNYEFFPVRFFGRTIYLADKPSWYMYYHLRNLTLIARRSKGAAVSMPSVAFRTIVDILLSLLFRDRKSERLRLLIRGLRDGLRNVSGKGPVP